jgi:hypothetical protein
LNTSTTATGSTVGTKFRISGRGLFVSLLVFAFAFIVTHFLSIPRSAHAVHHALNGAQIFDKAPSFSASEVYERIASFPRSGIYDYKQFTYTTDVLFPLTLLTFLVLLSFYVSERALLPQRYRTFLIVIPITWFAFDMIENVIVFRLLSDFPSRNEFLAGILGFGTVIKFSLLLISLVAPLVVKVFGKHRVRHFNA